MSRSRRLPGLSLYAAALALAVAACGNGEGAAPAPPDEVMFVTTAGGHAVLSTRSGARLASLPAGVLLLGLTAGVDVAEGYLVSTQPGGTVLVKIKPAARYAVEPLLTLPSRSAGEAALVDVPGLTSFTGRPTVVAIRMQDGSLALIQSGHPLPGLAPGSADELAAFAGTAFIRQGEAWHRLDPAAAGLEPTLPTGCRPVAAIGRAPVLQCGDQLRFRSASAPFTMAPGRFRAGVDGSVLLSTADGHLARIEAGGSIRSIRTGDLVPPALLGADLDTVYALNGPDAVVSVRLSDPRGMKRYLGSVQDGRSIALSRDGRFLLSVGGGRLEEFALPGGRRVLSTAAPGDEIEAVVGG